MIKNGLDKCRNIIWDWNGTLLNDLDVCVNSINLLLEKRNLSTLDRLKYLDIFTFPVKDYYETVGFNFNEESYETVAVEFMDHYFNLVKTAGLHPYVEKTLAWFRENGREQIILSAMEQNELNRLVKEYGIEDFFTNVFGISDHLAHGKLDLATSAIEITGFNREETCLIGDTLHDAEVANKLGIKCLLIADGHQSEVRLNESGFPVIRNLAEIQNIFGNNN